MQGWEIGLKYLHSASMSQAQPSINPHNILILKYVGYFLYCGSMLILYLTDIFTYPGHDDINVYVYWATH